MLLTANRRTFKAFSTNLDATGFTSKTAMAITAPSGTGVHDLTEGLGGGLTPARVRLFPYGLGSDNDVFSLRIWGWVRLGAGLWLPAILGEFSCTLSGFVGLAGQAVLNTERFCDTISLVANVGEATLTAATTRFGTARLYSPQNDTPGYVEVPTRGVEWIEFDGDQTTNTPTMNALVQPLEGLDS